MTAWRKLVRVPLSFSLRALMVVVTAMALCLGYEVNWIHQRHVFLAEQFECYLSAAPAPSEDIRREWAAYAWHNETPAGTRAPWGLQWFGENGFWSLPVIIPESDVTRRAWGHGGAGSLVKWPEVSCSQTEYKRAKRLFPEAQLRPVLAEKWSLEFPGGGTSGWLQPLVVREHAAETVVRVSCEPTVVERSWVSASIEVAAPYGGPVIVDYATCDDTATAREGNFIESRNRIFFGHSPFLLNISVGWLTDEQRAGGGATFKIKLGTVVGAIPEVTEKTITILPAKK